MKVRFRDRERELNVSTYQMICLLLFTDTDTLSYEQILEATNIPEQELQRNLKALSCGKYVVLKKNPSGPTVAAGDAFTFNQDMKCSQTRIKIQMATSRSETDMERVETRTKIDEDRVVLIEAVIVRIMKSRKRLDHNSLVIEVTEMLTKRFTPAPSLIKRCVERLMEREFIDRDPNSRSTYLYLA